MNIELGEIKIKCVSVSVLLSSLSTSVLLHPPAVFVVRVAQGADLCNFTGKTEVQRSLVSL